MLASPPATFGHSLPNNSQRAAPDGQANLARINTVPSNSNLEDVTLGLQPLSKHPWRPISNNHGILLDTTITSTDSLTPFPSWDGPFANNFGHSHMSFASRDNRTSLRIHKPARIRSRPNTGQKKDIAHALEDNPTLPSESLGYIPVIEEGEVQTQLLPDYSAERPAATSLDIDYYMFQLE